ncbi:MAG: phosphatase PAP2 family protein [Undibacterium sp.]|nr:phosphatase PAP2 family protein [Undibacterium sp.]
MIYWTTISNLGDIAATAPLAVGIAILFIVRRAWLLAMLWIILFVFGLGLVIVSKIAFVGWGIGHQALDFTGFSGHAMRAMAIFPVLGYLAAKKTPFSTQITSLVICTTVGTIVGISRLLLHVHSWSEVIAGWILGTAVSFCFIFLLRNWNNISFYPPLIMVALMPLVITPYLKPTPTQHWIINLSLYLSGHDQPFTRDDWTHSALRQAGDVPTIQVKAYSPSSQVPLSKKIPAILSRQ